MLIRWKVYSKHPIPTRIRTTIHNTFGRNSAPMVNIMSDNELYGTKDEVAPSVKVRFVYFHLFMRLFVVKIGRETAVKTELI